MTYLEKYYEAWTAYQNSHTDMDDVSKKEYRQFDELRNKAITESGLTHSEIHLICRCRYYDIFAKANMFTLNLARAIKNALRIAEEEEK